MFLHDVGLAGCSLHRALHFDSSANAQHSAWHTLAAQENFRRNVSSVQCFLSSEPRPCAELGATGHPAPLRGSLIGRSVKHQSRIPSFYFHSLASVIPLEVIPHRIFPVSSVWLQRETVQLWYFSKLEKKKSLTGQWPASQIQCIPRCIMLTCSVEELCIQIFLLGYSFSCLPHSLPLPAA